MEFDDWVFLSLILFFNIITAICNVILLMRS